MRIGEQRVLQVIAREDPARARHRRHRTRGLLVDAGDEHAVRARRRPDAIEYGAERHAFPVRGAHQPVVRLIGVARALDQVASARPGERLERRQGEIDGRVDEAADANASTERCAGSVDGTAVRTKKRSFGVTREAGLSAESCERSVNSRASSPEPRSRPNGGAGRPPGLPSGTTLTNRALDVCVQERRAGEARRRGNSRRVQVTGVGQVAGHG